MREGGGTGGISVSALPPASPGAAPFLRPPLAATGGSGSSGVGAGPGSRRRKFRGARPRHGLRPVAVRGPGGGGAAVRAVREGAGGAAVHSVRARLLRRLPTALGGAAPPLPAALPAAGGCRAAPRPAPPQPRPEAGGQVRLQPAGLRPHRAAAGAARAPGGVPLRAARPRRAAAPRRAPLAGQLGRAAAGGRRAPLPAGAAGRRCPGAGSRAEEGGPALEQEGEVAAGAAVGAAERGAADGAAVPGEVRPVHEPHQQHRPGPGGQPARQGECGQRSVCAPPAVLSSNLLFPCPTCEPAAE